MKNAALLRLLQEVEYLRCQALHLGRGSALGKGC